MTRIVALVAIVTFLSIMMRLVDFKLAGHFEICLFLACAVVDNALGGLMKKSYLEEAFVKSESGKIYLIGWMD